MSNTVKYNPGYQPFDFAQKCGDPIYFKTPALASKKNSLSQQARRLLEHQIRTLARSFGGSMAFLQQQRNESEMTPSALTTSESYRDSADRGQRHKNVKPEKMECAPKDSSKTPDMAALLDTISLRVGRDADIAESPRVYYSIPRAKVVKNSPRSNGSAKLEYKVTVVEDKRPRSLLFTYDTTKTWPTHLEFDGLYAKMEFTHEMVYDPANNTIIILKGTGIFLGYYVLVDSLTEEIAIVAPRQADAHSLAFIQWLNLVTPLELEDAPHSKLVERLRPSLLNESFVAIREKQKNDRPLITCRNGEWIQRELAGIKFEKYLIGPITSKFALNHTIGKTHVDDELILIDVENNNTVVLPFIRVKNPFSDETFLLGRDEFDGWIIAITKTGGGFIYVARDLNEEPTAERGMPGVLKDMLLSASGIKGVTGKEHAVAPAAVHRAILAEENKKVPARRQQLDDYKKCTPEDTLSADSYKDLKDILNYAQKVASAMLANPGLSPAAASILGRIATDIAGIVTSPTGKATLTPLGGNTRDDFTYTHIPPNKLKHARKMGVETIAIEDPEGLGMISIAYDSSGKSYPVIAFVTRAKEMKNIQIHYSADALNPDIIVFTHQSGLVVYNTKTRDLVFAFNRNTTSALLTEFRDTLGLFGKSQDYETLNCPIFKKLLEPKNLTAGDDYIYDRRLTQSANQTRRGYRHLVYKGRTPDDLVFIKYTSEASFGIFPDSVTRGSSSILPANQFVIEPMGCEFGFVLTSPTSDLHLVGQGEISGETGFPERFVVQSNAPPEKETLSLSPVTPPANWANMRCQGTQDGRYLLAFDDRAHKAVLIAATRGHDGQVLSIHEIGLLAAAANNGSTTKFYRGLGRLVGTLVTLNNSGQNTLLISKSPPISYNSEVIAPALELAPNFGEVWQPLNNAVLEINPPTSDHFDITIPKEFLDGTADIQTLAIDFPADKSKNTPPSRMTAKSATGKIYAFEISAEESNPGNRFTDLRIRAALRLGPWRLTVSFYRGCVVLGSYACSNIILEIFEIANYTDLYADFDNKEKLQAELNETLTTAWSGIGLREFEKNWQSPENANWHDYVDLGMVSGASLSGVRVAVRLGDRGQSKLGLTDGQQVFVKLTLLDKVEHEFVYVARGGQLEPWREQAPAGKIAIGIKGRQLVLDFNSGMIAAELARAYPVIETPQVAVVFDEAAKRLTGFKISGAGPAALLEQILTNNVSDRAAAIKERLDETLPALLSWHVTRADLRNPVINFVKPALVREEKKKLAVPVTTPAARPTSPAPKMEPAPQRPKPVEEKKLPPPKPVEIELKSSDTDLPALIFIGSVMEPISIFMSDSQTHTKAHDFLIAEQGADTSEIYVEFGKETWEITVGKDEAGNFSYARHDDIYKKQKEEQARQKEIAEKRRERHWFLDKRGDVEVLVLKNGMDEAVTDRNDKNLELTLVSVMGRRFVERNEINQSRFTDAGLNQLTLTSGSTHLEVMRVEPLVIKSLPSLSRDLVPIRAGVGVPLINLDHSISSLRPSVEGKRSEETDEIREALARAAIFTPTASAVDAVFSATTRGEKNVSMTNASGDTISLSIKKVARGWGWGEGSRLIRLAGEQRFHHLDGVEDKIGGEAALRFFGDDTRLMWDLRLGSLGGIPYIYGAHEVASLKNAGSELIDRLTMIAATQQADSGNAATVFYSATPPREEQSDDIIFGEALLKNALGSTMTLSYWRRSDSLFVDDTDILTAITTDKTGAAVGETLNLFVDRRTGGLYATAGDIMKPDAIYEIQWVLGSSPKVIPLLPRQWFSLRNLALNNRLLETLIQNEAILTRELGPSRPKSVSEKILPVVFDEGIPPLPSDEKFPFLFSTQPSGLDPVNEVGLDLVTALKDEIFLVAPQNTEDMVFGKPPLGTEKLFHFIGNRGDVLRLRLAYAQYEGRESQMSEGWVLSPSTHAQGDRIFVEVNGARINTAQYDRESVGQVIRFGANENQVRLRYFSLNNTCFGFREGDASTSAEGRANYTLARERLERLLEKSGALVGRFAVTEIQEHQAGAKAWSLVKGVGKAATTIELSYAIAFDDEKRAYAQLIDNTQINLTINKRSVAFAVFKIPGQEAILLREFGSGESDGAKSPRRYLLSLKPDGSPQLRQISQTDLNLTEAYLDADVWADGFVPVFKFGVKRGPLAILESANMKEWRKRLFGDDTIYKGNAGFLRWAREYFEGNIAWATRGAKLIANDTDDFKGLAWNTTSLSTYRQAREFFADKVTLSDGRVLKRDGVIFAAEIESDPLFLDMKGYEIERMMRHTAGDKSSIVRTAAGNVIIIKEHQAHAEQRLVAEQVRIQTTRSFLSGKVELDATVKTGDDRRKGDFIADEVNLDPEESLMNKELVSRARQKLPEIQQKILVLFEQGHNLRIIAKQLNLSFEEVDELYDVAMDALLTIVA